jgi:hypothetical protein
MAGDYNESVRPILAGVYTRFAAQRPNTPPPAAGTVVALPITHDWGPMDTETLLADYTHFQQQFGIGNTVSDTPGARAVYDAFRGEGLEGLGGAGGVLVTRFGGSAAAKASVTLQNGAGTPANALKVETRYETGKATLKLIVSPIVANTQTVDLYDGTTFLESYTYHTDVAPAMGGLRDSLNAISKVVEVPTDNTGLILEGTTGLAAGTFTLVGGNSGTVVTAGDWSAVLDTFANDDFAFLAPFDVPWAPGVTEPAPTNRSIIAALVQWVKDENARGHRVSALVGGALDELVADALARQAACASEFIITAGGPGVNDDLWGAWSTSQLVPRLAGIFANRGETLAAHFARLAGTLPRPKVGGGAISTADVETLTKGGVIALTRDRFRDAPTRLVNSVNTYIADTTDKPRVIYGNPKFVLSMQQFANEAEADLERFMVGRVVVRPETRSAAASRVLRIARRREPLAFNTGTKVVALDGEDTDEFVQLVVTLAFGRALAQLFIQANVR